jgi:topoisomerase-4 subunit A
MSVNIDSINFEEALSQRYISYAMATIMSRSLPDVRDGLKPVHRRLLYAMLKLKLDPDSAYKKCARVVGDVIGKFHPHGDQAVYDTLVRLAQSFAVRYPLIEGQGNFGSVDGDNAAAMRYTEAKLTKMAMLLLHDIDKDTVDFKKTYDDSDIEPSILPAKIPHLLANGSEGIAVGMATNIPPHNVNEICKALIYLLDNPECEIADLTNYIKGPDLPTGGIILQDKATIIKNYTLGKGSFLVRAKWHKEELSRGLYQIVITQIPYQVQKSKLIEKIADLYKQKKIPLLGNIRDESDQELRVIIEPKSKLVDENILMAQLFKLTDLETKFHLNLNVLNDQLVPGVMNLKQVLEAFLKHRFIILTRKANFELDKITHRLELLEGLLIAYLNLDRVIAIIREEDEAKAVLKAEFSLTEIQVEAILNMKLRALKKLEEMKIRQERDELLAIEDKLKKLLGSRLLQQKAIIKDLTEIQKSFNGKLDQRRTEIKHDFELQNITDTSFVIEEAITVFCSNLGWVRALNGHNLDHEKVKYRNGDKGRFIIELKTTDKLIIANDQGKFFTLDVHKILRGKTDGQSVNMIFDNMAQGKIVTIFIYKPTDNYIVATKLAKGFKIKASDVMAQTKSGKQILNLDKGDKLVAVKYITINDDAIAIVNSNRKMLIFNLADLPFMSKGKGVILQKQVDSTLSDVTSLNLNQGLYFQAGSKNRHEKDVRRWHAKRAGKGYLVPYGFAKNGKF